MIKSFISTPLLLACICLPIEAQVSVAPSVEAAIHEKMIIASAYRACEMALQQLTPIKNSVPVAIVEINEKFPSLSRIYKLTDTQQVESLTRKYCPILFGNLSSSALDKFKAYSRQAESLGTLIPAELRATSSSNSCSLNMIQLNHVASKGFIDVEGDGCKLFIKREVNQ